MNKSLRPRRFHILLLARRSVELAPYLLAFVVAKAAAFFGMLALGRYADPRVYGGIEFALTVGLLGATIALVGASGAVTRLVLKEGEPHIGDVLASMLAVITLLALLGGSAASIVVDTSLAIGIFLVPLTATQLASGTYFRIRQMKVMTAGSDVLAILTVLSLCAVIRVMFGRLTLPEVTYSIAGTSLVILIITLVAASSHSRPNLGERMWHAMRIGLPIMAFDLISQIVTQAPKLLIGWQFDLNAVALYSAYFRVASGMALIHQVIWGAFFVQLYSVKAKNVDKIYSLLAIMFVLAAVIIGIGLRATGEYLFPSLAGTARVHGSVAMGVASLAALWIQFAQLSSLVNREGISAKMTLAALTLLALLVVSLVIASMSGMLTLRMLLGGYASFLGLLNIAAVLLVAEKVAPLPFTALMSVVSVALAFIPL